jgi:peptidoglycan-associated lipoprotein
MKQGLLASGALVAVLGVAGCHKAPPIASRPPDTTPVANNTPSPTPVTPRSSGTPASPSQQVVENRRSATLTPQERATLNERLARLEDALFDYDKSTIRADATTALKDDVGVVRDILSNYPSQKLVIEGHADERGSAEYNAALGDRRAVAVRDFLTSMGISSGQLTVISYGKERPVCSEETEGCYQRNRRAHITAAAD